MFFMSFDFNFHWQKIKNGDERAFEALFKEMNGSLCYYALQLTNDQFIAQEIVQDVFLKIWQNRNQIVIKGSLKAYLYITTHNIALNTLIKNNNRRNSVSKLISNDLWKNIEATLEMNPFLLEKLEADEINKTIEKAINDLPQQCKEIFLLSRNQNKTNKEIAAILNIAEGTVKSQIFRALEKIETALEKDK
jgi:RNA polymerase sigma-70 factor, ECF subfamily